MALLTSVIAGLVLLLAAALLAGAGKRFLDVLGVPFDSALDSLLFSLTLGATALELAVTAGELLPNVRYGAYGASALVASVGIKRLPSVLRDLRALQNKFRSLVLLERFLAVSLFLVLALEALAALAPLTGSDALHYHFTAQANILRYGFRADWSLLHGFFCGLGHQLILVGLAFGSDQLATGLIYLGGLAATLATLRLAQQWIGGAWPWAAALAFALTPVTFWQVTSAGAPDVWMCALLPLGVLAILLAARSQTVSASILAGVIAGAIAGIKYTGVLMAAALLLAFALEMRSVKKCLLFFSSALVVGIWPYVRNLVWTGDPIFPFLFVRRYPFAGNLTALGWLLKDTGASNPHPFSRVIRFPLFAVSDHDGLAAWQFLGPLVLAFAPVALLSFQRSSLWRVALLVWLTVSLGVGVSSGIPRFLLPVLPLALAASIGGVAVLIRDRFPALRAVFTLSLAGFCMAGFAALAAYCLPAWSVALGRVSPETYLRTHAPDYAVSQFVNVAINNLAANPSGDGRALVFFRHLYYVRVPFMDGATDDSWEMNPATLQTGQAWRDLFSRERIRWVVQDQDYPAEFNDSLLQLEKTGMLTPCAAGSVQSIQGFRINAELAATKVTIFCVAP